MRLEEDGEIAPENKEDKDSRNRDIPRQKEYEREKAEADTVREADRDTDNTANFQLSSPNLETTPGSSNSSASCVLKS